MQKKMIFRIVYLAAFGIANLVFIILSLEAIL